MQRIITLFVVSVPQLLQQAIESESKLGLAIKPYVQQDISGMVLSCLSSLYYVTEILFASCCVSAVNYHDHV